MIYFDLCLPFFRVHTELMRYAEHRMTFNYVVWHIKVWKWHWTVDWNKSEIDRLEKRMSKHKFKSQEKP